MENDYDQLLKINYASIQDKNQLQNLIIEHKAVISNLTKQVHQLININDKETLQKDLIMNKMQQNMLENTQQIIKYKNLINHITDQHQKLTKQFEDQKQKSKKNIQAQQLSQVNELSKKLEQLDSQYKSLRQIEQKQQDYQVQIKRLKQALVNKQYEHHDNMNKQQKKQIKQNNQFNNQNQNKIEQTKKNVYNVAKNIVITQKINNQEKNTELKMHLLSLQQQLAVLKKNRNDLLSKKKEFKMNININQQQLEEYKAVGSLQKAKIKNHKDKIDQLKTLITEEVAKKESKVQQIKKQRNSQMKALKVRLAHLERQKDEKKMNFQKMKVLADTILLQREQVEQFFIMALQHVKVEIQKQNQNAFSKGRQQENKGYGQKVDIEQLSAKDKQKILTNLYTKLALGP